MLPVTSTNWLRQLATDPHIGAKEERIHGFHINTTDDLSKGVDPAFDQDDFEQEAAIARWMRSQALVPISS